MRLPACIAILPLLFGPSLRAHPDPSHTLAEIESHLAETPDNPDLLYRKASVLLDGRHPKSARVVADQALGISPRDPALLLLRARISEALGDPRDAISRAGAILLDYPDFTRAAGYAARLHYRAGRIDEAITLKQRHLQGNDIGPEDFLAAATWLRERNQPGDREAAVADLDRAIARSGVITSLQQAAIELECSLGRHDAALARVDALVSKFQPSVAFSLLRADIFESAGRHREAANACDSALALLELEPSAAQPEIAPLKNTLRERKQANLLKAAETSGR